jgi:hypothetical protein
MRELVTFLRENTAETSKGIKEEVKGLYPGIGMQEEFVKSHDIPVPEEVKEAEKVEKVKVVGDAKSGTEPIKEDEVKDAAKDAKKEGRFEVTDELVDEVAKDLEIDFAVVNRDQLKRGMEVEQEHISHFEDPKDMANIALDHLKEIADYYTRLDAMEAQAKQEPQVPPAGEPAPAEPSAEPPVAEESKKKDEKEKKEEIKDAKVPDLSKSEEDIKMALLEATDDAILNEFALMMKDDAFMKDHVNEVAPEGWEPTVKAMKKHKDITNPWALAYWMKNKGYKSHEAMNEQEYTVLGTFSDEPTAKDFSAKNPGTNVLTNKDGKFEVVKMKEAVAEAKKDEKNVKEMEKAAKLAKEKEEKEEKEKKEKKEKAKAKESKLTPEQLLDMAERYIVVGHLLSKVVSEKAKLSEAEQSFVDTFDKDKKALATEDSELIISEAKKILVGEKK